MLIHDRLTLDLYARQPLTTSVMPLPDNIPIPATGHSDEPRRLRPHQSPGDARWRAAVPWGLTRD